MAQSPVVLDAVDFHRFDAVCVKADLATVQAQHAMLAAKVAQATQRAVFEEMAKKYPALSLETNYRFNEATLELVPA